MGAAFSTHATVLTDEAIERVCRLPIRVTPYVRHDITPTITDPPCNGCPLTTWCRVAKEECRAFEAYIRKGEYLDNDIGTLTNR